jgi:hypothetical protein
VTVTLEPPELVRVSDNVWLLPTGTLPKLRLVAVTVSDPGVTPVPESGTAKVGFDALLVMDRFPLADPPVVGVNVTLKVALWPAAKVAGKLSPLTLYGAAVVAALTVTLEPPELVRVSDNVWLFPTCTLPKLRLAAVAVSDPAVTPEPESGIPRFGFDALLVMERLPVADPPVVGVNVTLKVALWPAARVAGKPIPVML